jgi:serine/threonine protein kinase
VIGEVLGERYKILSEIGGGGMGVVYEARHTGTGRRVAVKVLTSDLAKNATLVERFYREARAAGAIEAQHIVQVLDTGTDPKTGAPFMVMEYLDGEDLYALFYRLGPLPPELALRITAQACLGLQKAHEARVIHRDIKPGNLFLTKRDDETCLLKILDFGIAKIRPDEVSQVDTGALTRTGSMLGSPLYMSPEQARGQKNIDHRSDIWSLGVVLYQALTGRRPHEDVDALGDLIIAICSEAPEPAQDVAPWIPAEIAAIAHRAMSFDPAARFQSAAEMFDAIKVHLPRGFAIEPAMLVSLTEQERAVIAPRTASPAPRAEHAIVRPADPHAVGIPGDPTLAGAPAAATRSVPPPAEPPRGASPSLRPSDPRPATPSSRGPRTRRRAKRSSVPVLAGAVLLIAFAIGGVFYMRARSLEQQAASPSSALPVAPQSPSATTLQAASPPDPASALRTVEITVTPPEATVTVDGEAAKIQAGIVSLVGTLGSVHRVRVALGAKQTEVDVVVAQSGAVPAKIELTKGK